MAEIYTIQSVPHHSCQYASSVNSIRISLSKSPGVAPISLNARKGTRLDDIMEKNENMRNQVQPLRSTECIPRRSLRLQRS